MFEVAVQIAVRCVPVPFAILIAGLSGMAWAGPGEMQIQRGGQSCAPTWQLSLDQVPLRLALERLAEAVGFDLSYRADSNPARTLDAELDAVELIRRLVGPESVVMSTEPLEGCPDAVVLSRVVILPLGEAGPLPDREHVPEGMRRYREAHGMDPITGELNRGN